MINLIPPELKQDIKYGKLNVTLVQYWVLLVMVLVMLVGLLIFGAQVVSTDQQALKESIAEKQLLLSEISGDVEAAKTLESTVETIGKLLEREVSFSQLIREIGAVIPVGANLSNLTLTGNESAPLVIEAEVNSQELAAVVRENLEKSDLFGFADIQSIDVSDTDSAGNALSYIVQIVVNFESEVSR